MSLISQHCKALSDENRIKILELLKPGNVCACELLERLQITQPTLSHHMKILVESGLVLPKKDGKWVRYSLDQSALQNLMHEIEKLI
ncbi:MAG: metalloregulator ArsR/SmtB family transcription factor [Eubacteriales bacterium]